jgi:sugar/nucleoside kinase (ribokinase family)
VIGGNGASVAYLLGRLGHRVSLNTRIGPDAFGDVLSEWLADAGVCLVGQPASRTAVNTILLDRSGARRSLYYTGDPVDWLASAAVRDVDWLYASGYGQVTAGDLETLTAVFGEVRARGARVAFDPGPWFYEAAGAERVWSAWREVDCLIGTEAELSTGRRAGKVEALVSEILDAGIRRVIVKRGRRGAAFGEAGRRPETVAVTPVEAANTVGAGDSFNAGLLHRLVLGDPLRAAVTEGLALAGRAVRSGRGAFGALGAMASPDRV